MPRQTTQDGCAAFLKQPDKRIAWFSFSKRKEMTQITSLIKLINRVKNV